MYGPGGQGQKLTDSLRDQCRLHTVRKAMASDMKGQMAVGGELNPLEGRRMVNKLEDLEEAPAGSSLSDTHTERVPPNC